MPNLQTIQVGTQIRVRSTQLEVTDIQLIIRERLLGKRWKAMLTVIRTDLESGVAETLTLSADELLYYLE